MTSPAARFNRLLLLPLTAAACVAAWQHAFLQDDAFISFRYAAHLAAGEGLRWYPGSSEFGFTNMLFTLLVALGLKFGATAETASYCISIPAYAAALAGVWRLARITNVSAYAPPLAAWLLILNYTFTSYATGGLETSLQTAFIVWAYVLLWRSPQNAWLIGIFALFAMLTRLDSMLLLLPLYALLALSDEPSALFKLARAALLPTVGTLALLAICYGYYGYALPTSFAVKMDGAHISEGLSYLALYLKTEGYMPLAMFAYGLLALAFYRSSNLVASVLWLAVCLIWLAYIIFIGGDFMEFRMLVPVMPFFVLFCVSAIPPMQNARKLALLSVGLGALGLYIHESQYGGIWYDQKTGVESTASLNRWIIKEHGSWPEIGKKLHGLFYTGHESNVKIAVTASGAIPYYSGLPTLDMLGLNTRDVLAHSQPFLHRPGHRIIAEKGYAAKNGANLVLGHPAAQCDGAELVRCPQAGGGQNPTADGLIMRVALPLKDGCRLDMFYRNFHPDVEKSLQDGSLMCLK